MPKLSIYDEKLSDIAKEGIRSAKQSYEAAKKNNDTVSMARANANANNIRRIYGGYTGGDDGSAFYPVNNKEKTKPTYKSQYEGLIKNTQNKIINKPAFSYDPDTDPAFILYKKIYTQMGNDAYDRALSQNAIKTGGIVNTNAMTSAMLAKNAYNAELAKAATQLYNNAYKEYKDSLDYEYDKLKMLNDYETSDYSKYKDTLSDFNAERDFDYQKYKDETANYLDELKYASEFAYQKQQDAIQNQRLDNQFDYQKQQDAIQNQRQDKEFEYQKNQDSIENKRLNDQFEYQKSKDAKQLEFDNKKLNTETEKWKKQSEIDKYNALARLIQSVYNKSNIGVNIQKIKNVMGI